MTRRAGLTRRQLLAATAAAAVAVPAGRAAPPAPTAAAAAPVGERLLGRGPWGTLRSLAQTMLPAGAEMPGAEKSGVCEYIERALEGPYSRYLGVYRRLLAELDSIARAGGDGSFDSLPVERAREVVRKLEASLPQDFALLRQHVLEGFLSDPVHGGNRDRLGWQAVGLVHKHKD
ncbi:MAG: gluconate 2-dehydrogenase subunit 3 family protein [Candidatus Wallbacteria bacterium]|nr:gluconate 2-dehydrogenase subunit 3 family protein [Candidatus Wallbacteria bacterium]